VVNLPYEGLTVNDHTTIFTSDYTRRQAQFPVPGTLNLAKIGQKLINDSWDSWWPPEDEEIILKQIEPKKGYYLPREDKYDRHYTLPVLVGPHQDRTWVKQLKELIGIH